MAEFGQILGEAVDFQYDQRINDLRYAEQVRKQNEALAESKAALLAKDLDYQNAMNPFDNPRIKAANKERIMNIGKFTRNNPSWMSDPMLRAQVKEMSRELLDNPDMIRGKTTDDNVKAYIKDLQEAAKSPDQHDMDSYMLEQKRIDNYNMFGNPDGKEAADKEGLKPYIYTKPQDFIDENELFRKTGTSLKANAYENINNGNVGAHRTFLNEADLEKEAAIIYKSRQRQFDVKYKNKGVDPIKAIMDGIRPFVDTKLDLGHENTFAKQMALEKYRHDLKRADSVAASGGSPYRISILEPGATAPPAKTLAAVFGSNIPTYYKDATGKMVQNKDGDTFNYYDDLKDRGYGQKGYKKTGIKQPTGYFIKPLEWGKEQGYLHDKWLDGKDLIVKPEFADIVSVIDSPVDEKGNSHKLLKVEAVGEVDANDPTYEAAYNKLFLTNKQRDNVDVEENLLTTPQQTYGGYVVGSEVRNKKDGKIYVITANGPVLK